MKKRIPFLLYGFQLLFLYSICSGHAKATPHNEEIPSPQEMLAKVKQSLPPFSFSIEKDEVVTSHTDPSKKLRRIEVSFLSQVLNGIKMYHSAAIYLPLDTKINKHPERRGKVVIVTHRSFDTSMEWNYVEPIATRTEYPTMHLELPSAFPGKEGESPWLRYLRKKAQETRDPSYHDFVRLALPYLQALDIFEDILQEKNIRAIIGGHSKRAYYAYTAAALDPERIASVIFMGCERLYYRDEFPEAVKPFTTQKYVRCPVFYIGATNEGGYEMFNINKIQERMQDDWTIEYIPNYRHASNSEKQFLNWPMWVSHIFDGRPVVKIRDMSFEETETGTRFRARIDSENKIILVKAWYAFCDDEPFWRDLVWYPNDMKQKEGNVYECHVNGILPDAWLVEVKDTAHGYQGYLSSLPMDITHKATKERTHAGPGGRNWRPKKKTQTK
jgi:hypothetical protein